MIYLIARQFWVSTLRSKVLIPIYAVWLLLVIYAALTTNSSFSAQSKLISEYQHKARESWESNPDKHPHRMAHFGSFAFRQKYPLSVFDNGIESFTGNAVYLEAHKQNTVNFSEAGFSTGIVRFGELNLSVLLQIVLPLILFFLGFQALASQKENGTLKILSSQGAGFRSLITGNSIGLFSIGLVFAIPVLAASVMLVSNYSTTDESGSLLSRSILLILAYLVFVWVMSTISIAVSALSNSSRSALLSSLGLWLLLTIVIPKTLQALGSFWHPAPGKIEFETLVESEILQQGDSHNPDDPVYKHLKDSVLRANKVDSVQQLNFNYSGYQMFVGEQLSAKVYQQELQSLNAIYNSQNSISYLASFVNPVIGIKNLSMALSGTDFDAYLNFQQQAEAYRYKLAQTMNELQMKYISNRKPGPEDKPQIIDRKFWREFPDFQQQFPKIQTVLSNQVLSLSSLVSWLILSVGIILLTAQKAKVI